MQKIIRAVTISTLLLPVSLLVNAGTLPTSPTANREQAVTGNQPVTSVPSAASVVANTTAGGAVPAPAATVAGGQNPAPAPTGVPGGAGVASVPVPPSATRPTNPPTLPGAASPAPVPTSAPGNVNPATMPTPAPGATPAGTDALASQQQITHALQDNILFERERRQLTNELALAKLRAELQKIRQQGGTNAPPSTQMMPAMPSPAMPAQIAEPVTPQILLVSQVGGVLRIAVSAGSGIKLVKPHGIFSADGKTWRVVTNKKKQYVIQEQK